MSVSRRSRFTGVAVAIVVAAALGVGISYAVGGPDSTPAATYPTSWKVRVVKRDGYTSYQEAGPIHLLRVAAASRGSRTVSVTVTPTTLNLGWAEVCATQAERARLTVNGAVVTPGLWQVRALDGHPPEPTDLVPCSAHNQPVTPEQVLSYSGVRNARRVRLQPGRHSSRRGTRRRTARGRTA